MIEVYFNKNSVNYPAVKPKPSDLSLVALVGIAHCDFRGTESMDFACSVMTSVNGVKWYDNNHVFVCNHKIKKYKFENRSIQTGDVLKVGDDYFYVDYAGFEKFTWD